MEMKGEEYMNRKNRKQRVEVSLLIINLVIEQSDRS